MMTFFIINLHKIYLEKLAPFFTGQYEQTFHAETYME
jgi:hypothetical protein